MKQASPYVDATLHSIFFRLLGPAIFIDATKDAIFIPLEEMRANANVTTNRRHRSAWQNRSAWQTLVHQRVNPSLK